VASERDEFPKQTKELLAKRVGFLCSLCSAKTVGPAEDDARAVNIGVAAHITAAAENGPRFEPTLLPEERSSPSNGIWLCQSCAARIDRDVLRFTKDRLLAAKARAEASANSALGRIDVGSVPLAEAGRWQLITTGLSVAVECFDLLWALRYANTEAYDRVVESGTLERSIQAVRAKLIPLEAIVGVHTAKALHAYVNRVHAVEILATVTPGEGIGVDILGEAVRDQNWSELDRALRELQSALRLETEPPTIAAARMQADRAREGIEVHSAELVAGLRGLAHVLVTFGVLPVEDSAPRFASLERRIVNLSESIASLGQAVGQKGIVGVRTAVEDVELRVLPSVKRSLEGRRRAQANGAAVEPYEWSRVFARESARLTSSAAKVEAEVGAVGRSS
jgi:hypothetical protein